MKEEQKALLIARLRGKEKAASVANAAKAITAVPGVLLGLKELGSLGTKLRGPRGVEHLIGKPDSLRRKVLTYGAGPAAVGAGVSGLNALARSLASPVKKKGYFVNMMDENPTLKRENSRDVKRIFNTLYRFSPAMASDPLVAGSFMKRSLQFKEEGIQPADVKQLTDITGGLAKARAARKNILEEAFAATSAGLAGLVS